MPEDWFTQNAPTPVAGGPASTGGDWFKRNAPKTIPGMEKLGELPGVDASTHKPPGLGDDDNAIPLTRLGGRGLPVDFHTAARIQANLNQAGRGVAGLAGDQPMGGAADILEGAGGAVNQAAMPLMAPMATANPAMTLRALVGALSGSKGSSLITQAAGGDEDAQRVVSVLGGIAGGGAATRPTPGLDTAVSGAASGLVKSLPDMLEKIPIIRAAGPPIKGLVGGAREALAARTTAQAVEAQRLAGRTPGWQAAATPGFTSLAAVAEMTPEEIAEAGRQFLADNRAARAQANYKASPAAATINKLKALGGNGATPTTLADLNSRLQHALEATGGPMSPAKEAAIEPDYVDLLQKSIDAVKAKQTGKVANMETKPEWELKPDPEQQGEIDEGNIAKLRKAYREGSPVPPIVAYDIGDGQARIIEGHHRFAAANAEGIKPEVIVMPKEEFNTRRSDGETLDEIEYSAQAPWRKQRDSK